MNDMIGVTSDNDISTTLMKMVRSTQFNCNC